MTYLDRLVEEKEELETRFYKLQGFIDNEGHLALPVEDQNLLVIQMNTMQTYLSILTIRLGGIK